MDPELPLRSRTDPLPELPMEEVEPALRRVRLVWTSATDVGVVGRDLRAVAAAAEDNEVFEFRWERKADAAAVIAEESTLGLERGCSQRFH